MKKIRKYWSLLLKFYLELLALVKGKVLNQSKPVITISTETIMK